MNRLIVFPLTFLFLLTIYAFIFTGETFTSDSEDYSSGAITIDGNETTIDVPAAESQELSMWESTGAIAIILIAITVGILAGIKVLGSGLSDLSQKMIFNSILFMGMWGILSIIASDFLFEYMVTEIMWFGMTVMYVIGLGTEISSGGEG